MQLVQGISNLVLVLVAICIFFSFILVGIIYRIVRIVRRINESGEMSRGWPGSLPSIPPLAALRLLEDEDVLLDEEASDDEEQIEDNDGSPSAEGKSSPNSEPCVICLGVVRWAVETNCGHLFCCSCFWQYFRHGRNRRPQATGFWRRIFLSPASAVEIPPVICPCCRRKVAFITPAFGLGRRPGRRLQSKMQTIADYNNRFSGQRRSLWDTLLDTPLLLRRFCRDLSAGRALFLFSHARVIFVLALSGLYVLSPLDIIPEAVFGVFGLIDDIFVVLLSAIYLSVIYRSIVQNRLALFIYRRSQRPPRG